MQDLDTARPPWSISCEEIAADLTPAGSADGLTEAEVAQRLDQYGPNTLAEPSKTPWWILLAEQLKSLVVLLLVAAAILSGAFGDWIECAAIVVVIAINTAIGFVTELKAVRSMDALRRLTEIMATVRRNGAPVRVNAKDIVPGDIVVLEAGDLTPADLRLLEASQLQINESALTGESVPVEKQTDVIAMDTPLAERANMAFKSSPVTRGSGLGVVTATGTSTEIGKISILLAETPDEGTPLDKQLDVLAGRLVWVTLAVVLLTGALGILAGKEAYLMIQTSIALAVAAIPEGLPVVATIALARGMWRMADRNALINRLSAVETLGATSIICTDKTGTLTENEMTLVRLALPGEELELTEENRFARLDASHAIVVPADDETFRVALEDASLCNNAAIDANGNGIGDPLEVALLAGADTAGIDRPHLHSIHERVSETAFDSDIKMMATHHRAQDGRWLVAVKGAAESVLGACTDLSEDERDRWLDRNESMAAGGLRVLALARKVTADAEDNPYHNLEFLGLAGLLDPPRNDVASSLEACNTAGIRVVMMTGDQAATATNVARRVGLLAPEEEAHLVKTSDLHDMGSLDGEQRERVLEASIFSRVTPKQKLEIIKLHQNAGNIVAMTGDGVNDAPALRQADIGIAMGCRGTEVAKEAADMILRDDRFATIVEAVFHGRIIFANIRKFVIYLMSCNLSEILVIGLGAALVKGLPILPLQILFLNLVTDVFPALALGAGAGSTAVMQTPPRPAGESILRRREWTIIVAFSLVLAVAVLGAYLVAERAFGFDEIQCITVAFLVLAFAQLWHVFNMADTGEIAQNRYIWAALALCTALILSAFYVPPLANVMGLAPIGSRGWTLVLGASFAPLLIGQLWRRMATRSSGSPAK